MGTTTTDDVELVGRRARVIGGWCWQAALLVAIVVTYRITHRPLHGQYVLPALCIVWIAMAFGVAVAQHGLLHLVRARLRHVAGYAYGLTGLLGIGLAVGAAAGPVNRWLRHAGPFGPGPRLWAALLAVFVVGCAWPWSRPGSFVVPAPASEEAPRPEIGGVIVCCSGGGIRSAAFSLGALQRLDRSGFVARARALVSASGGSYIAAAYASLAGAERRGGARPFDPGSAEVAQIRKATNYLASSARVKYDAVASWFFGALVNGALLWSAISVLSGLIAWWVVTSGVMVAVTSDTPWSLAHTQALTEWLVAPVVVGFLVFLLGRRLRWFTRARGIARLYVGTNARDRAFWASSRLAFTTLGLAGLVALWLVPSLAVAGHNAVLADRPTHALASLLAHTGFGPAPAAAPEPLAHPPSAGTLGSIGAVGAVLMALIRSAMKGWRSVQTEAPSLVRLLNRYRLRIAPLVASGVFGLAVLYATTAWVASSAAQPQRFDEVVHFWTNPFMYVAPLLLLWPLNANAGSLFQFYRDRIAGSFLLTREEGTVRPQLQTEWQQLSELSSTGVPHRPELVLTATANIQDGDMLPTGRNGAQFVFSGTRIGLHGSELPGDEGRRWLPAATFERHARGLRVADAVAVSGAALAPLAGRESKIVAPFRVLMAVANVRMGLWVPNPCWIRGTADPPPVGAPARALLFLDALLRRPNAWNLAVEAFTPPSIYRPFLYLTDGGHYDNLGLVEALRRRPSLVVVLDASADAEDGFATMAAAIATARMDGVAEIDDFDPAPLVRGSGTTSQRGWVVCHARYPQSGEPTTRIVYLKSVLTHGLSWDVEGYKLLHPEFPLTSTGNQLFDEFDFEAYRRLGYCLADQMVQQGGLDSTAGRGI